MQVRILSAVFAFIIVAAGTSRADFKYTQQSKVTGGALVGVTKTLGVFSKNAREVTAPQTSTTMIRGNRLRTEHSDGRVEIIDLDGRRFIHIDPAKKVYWVQTFDQFKQQMEQAREKAKEEQTKRAAKHGEAQNVTMVPKFDVKATGQTRTIMNIPTKEMKMRVDILFQSTDPKTQADLEKSNTSMWMTGDAWYGSVPGYDELRKFYQKMAKELDWFPGTVGMANPQMTQASEEFKKAALQVDGMPLVQYTSFGMAGNGQSGQPAQGGDQAAQNQKQPDKSSSNDSSPANARDALTKGLGGLFGKKKQQQQQNDSDAKASGSSAAPPPASTPGSMMDMTIEVTSYSKDSLDANLFDVPAGYTQVQTDTMAK